MFSQDKLWKKLMKVYTVVIEDGRRNSSGRVWCVRCSPYTRSRLLAEKGIHGEFNLLIPAAAASLSEDAHQQSSKAEALLSGPKKALKQIKTICRPRCPL